MHSGTIDFWADGMVTRGVLYDIPRLRGTDYTELGHPVWSAGMRAAPTGWSSKIELMKTCRVVRSSTSASPRHSRVVNALGFDVNLCEATSAGLRDRLR